MADISEVLLQRLKQAVAAGTNEAVPEALAIRQHAVELRAELQYGGAVSLLSAAREIAAQTPDLRPQLSRDLAFTLGARVEAIMGQADLFGIAPDDALLEQAEADLQLALSYDPSIADLHWNAAVIAARFRGAWDEAAARLAEARRLGYQHPMEQRLQALIEARRPPVQAADGGRARLSRLLLSAAMLYHGAQRPSLFNDSPTLGRGGVPLTFGDFAADAVQAACEDPLAEGQWDELMHRASRLPGDLREIVADLIRRAATDSQADAAVVHRSTEMHLSVLLAQTQSLLEQGERTHQPVWYRRAYRGANRALGIVADREIDPDLHADLLLARGSAQWRIDPSRGAAVLADYRVALRLKRKAGNEQDSARLTAMIWQQIDARVKDLTGAMLLGGVGGAYAELQAFAEAAEELDDPQRALWVQLQLACGERQLGLREDAEARLRSIVDAAEDPSVRFDALFELASVLSETNRAAEAAHLQEQLIAQKEGAAHPTLWTNYANSLLRQGRFDEARAAAEKAWALHETPQPAVGSSQTIDLQGAHIRTIQAQIANEFGDVEAAFRYVEEASRLNPMPHGLAGLHQLSLTAAVLFAAGRSHEGVEAVAQADALLVGLLKRRPALPVWEAMLRDWSRLDAMAVRRLTQQSGEGSAERALLRAEAAKGRIQAWLENAAHPADAGAAAFDSARLQAGLGRVQAWLKRKPGCLFLSLFATADGLAVFGIDAAGVITACWLEDQRYTRLNEGLFDPWERLVARAMDGAGGDSLLLAGAVTEHLLDRVGAALARALPRLADGGPELAISPHRLFRNLPLAHVRLPFGKRLSELFGMVCIVPGLASLRDAPEPALRRPVAAVGDPDGSLPFARIEALAIGGADAVVGRGAGRDALMGALRHPRGPLLLSTHARFEPTNPFTSYLVAADGHLALHQFLRARDGGMAPAVILGACEAGKSRRSLSDEPFGFPMMLLQLGCREVAAPCWKVDDFASFVLLTECCARLANGVTLPEATTSAALSVRDMTPAAALERLEAAVALATEPARADWAERSGLLHQAAGLRRWLNRLEPVDRPFESPLDWAAFQVSVSALS
jgi:tetratricopeptide (TPR) repeat protein